MKKTLIIIFVVLNISISMPQEKKGGYISLTLNNKKIDLPIFTVMLRKENAITITARGENNTEDIAQMISMEFRLRGLYKDSIDVDGFGFDIVDSDRKLDVSTDVSLRMENYARSSTKIKGNRSSFEASSFQMKFAINEILFQNNKLIINGVFNFKIYNKEAKAADYCVADIKDGAFRIEI
ncbi:MAG: hypothetical protein Q8903_04385 [Bacteroidota bacterium]|nr:hypothetical protein [Bacteroidota bacterium]